MFCVGAAFAVIGFIPIALLLVYWSSTKKPKDEGVEKKDYLAEIDAFIKNPETWEYAADKPMKKEFAKLGTEFGGILIERGYQWKRYYSRFFEVLSLTLPPIRPDNFEHHYEDFRFIRQNLEKVRWEWDHVKSLQQVSFIL